MIRRPQQVFALPSRLISHAGLCAMLLASTVSVGLADSGSAPRLVPAAADPFGSRRLDHGWFVAPGTPSLPPAVMHIPPHDSPLAPMGAVKLASVLNENPVALIAMDDEVLIVTASARGGGGPSDDSSSGAASSRIRRVVSMRAVRTLGGSWEYLPRGRTAVRAELAGDGQIVATAPSASGPVVLLGPRQADACPSLLGENVAPPAPASLPWRLFRLEQASAGSAGDSESWVSIALPSDWLTESSIVRLATMPDGACHVWQELPALASAGEVRVGSIWRIPTTTSDRPGLPEATPLPAGGFTGMTLISTGGWPLATRAGGVKIGEMTIYSMAGGVWRTLGVLGMPGLNTPATAAAATPPQARAMLMLAGRNELVSITVHPDLAKERAAAAPAEPAASEAPAPAPDSVPTLLPGETDRRGEARSINRASLRGFDVTILDAGSGGVLYEGPARREGVITTRDFHLLTLAFASTMVMVLVFVMQSDRQSMVVLPTGCSLPTGLQRAGATLADLLAVLLIGAVVLRLPVAELFSVELLTNPSQALLTVGTLMTLGAVLGTMCEAIWGRTPGKLLFGLDVLAMVRVPTTGAPAVPPDGWARIGSYDVGAPTLSQAARRNVVKWMLFPLTLVGLFDAHGRHPADLLAKTIVVRPPDSIPDEQDDESEDGR